jgi:hypothetical protein
MNTPLLTALALVAVAAGTPAPAENRQLIDDFSSGHFQAKPIKKGGTSSSQTGSMVGGARSTTLTLCSTHCNTANPYAQTAAYSYVPVTDLAFVYQSGSTVGGVEFGIRSIEVSDTPQAGAFVCSLTGG